MQKLEECCGLREMKHKPFGFNQHVQKDGAKKGRKSPLVGAQRTTLALLVQRDPSRLYQRFRRRWMGHLPANRQSQLFILYGECKCSGQLLGRGGKGEKPTRCSWPEDSEGCALCWHCWPRSWPHFTGCCIRWEMGGCQCSPLTTS